MFQMLPKIDSYSLEVSITFRNLNLTHNPFSKNNIRILRTYV